MLRIKKTILSLPHLLKVRRGFFILSQSVRSGLPVLIGSKRMWYDTVGNENEYLRFD